MQEKWSYFDACYRMLEFHQKEIQRHHSLEWQVFFSVVTAVLAAPIFFGGKVELSVEVILFYLFVFVMVFVIWGYRNYCVIFSNYAKLIEFYNECAHTLGMAHFAMAIAAITNKNTEEGRRGVGQPTFFDYVCAYVRLWKIVAVLMTFAFSAYLLDAMHRSSG